MAGRKMIILRGSAANGGKHSDAQGKKNAWPDGALQVKAAEDYATRAGYDPVVLDVEDFPQSRESPQATAALKELHKDESDVGFYGFSGGGYNVRHVLEYLADKEPQSLHRIKHVVVIGAPFKEREKLFAPARYNARVPEKANGKDRQAADWVVVYRENPDGSQMPKELEVAGTHMFRPDVLLKET